MIKKKPCGEKENDVILQADISQDIGTTIRQVRAEAYRLCTTATCILRQN